MQYVILAILFVVVAAMSFVAGVKYAPIVRAEEEALKAREDELKKIL